MNGDAQPPLRAICSSWIIHEYTAIIPAQVGQMETPARSQEGRFSIERPRRDSRQVQGVVASGRIATAYRETPPLSADPELLERVVEIGNSSMKA